MDYYPYSLSVERLRLHVLLGVGKEERKAEQPIELSIVFHFRHRPEACDDDEGKFICYDGVCRHIIDTLKGQEFRLIEYLCPSIHQMVRDYLTRKHGNVADDIALSLTINKCSPPVPYDVAGVLFAYSDLPQNAVVRAG